MLVRDAVAERDAARCAEVYGPYVRTGFVSFEEQAPGPLEMARRILGAQRRHHWLVAEDDDGGGRVAGFAYAGPFKSRPGYRWAAEVSVYVAREAHRGGAGRALYSELLARCRADGLRALVAVIAVPNPASVGFHESFGFRQVGLQPAIAWKAGAWRDVGTWQLDLFAPTGTPPREPRG